ncbi:phosphatase PAP2 family protein [Phytomonospora endophytica]|uniref:Membrane-associated phospholipid phosphatase n=1 Tax=Phytomonospora endophytica TaxID=714109 RepID=A0A841G2I3_9ACTN|nr:phosphatase PAP2 family protein [Phytomonospora endophytica]MBB6038909.1 membrane-associated phospholipid phosphatase [Phytomonospora endophytica]GIG67989.1 hypothetical protein Pen01_42840 [Phytomonospora endophytica]
MTTSLPRPQRRAPAAVAVLLTGAVLCALAVVATYLLAVQTYTGQALENQGLDATYGAEKHPAAFSLLGFVGSPPLILGALAAVILLGALTRSRSTGRRRVRYGVAGAAVAALSIATTEVLKSTLPRPDLDLYGTGLPLHNSFPSGHTTVAAGIGLGLLLAAPPVLRALLAAPVVFVTALVAAATIVTGWHRVSDTIGAALIAATYFFLAATLTGLPERTTPATHHHSHAPAHLPSPWPPHPTRPHPRPTRQATPTPYTPY